MRFALMICLVGLLLSAQVAAEQTHTVASGHTLGAIAKRYHVSIQAICHANGISRKEPIVPGQKLIIPDKNDKDGSKARAARLKEKKSGATKPRASASQDNPGGMQTLQVPGFGDAYYYEPTGPGRLSLRPVLMYLHGRSGNPQQDCRRWAPVARRLGWLMCPRGPASSGRGSAWNNNWASARRAVMASLNSLRNKYGRRVQLYGNTLIGFSEGAYVAMNVGVREPRAFNRWLILAGNDSYWGPLGHDRLERARHRLRKVYLITGEQDGVIEGTRDVREVLRKMGIATRITTPKEMGHELPLEKQRGLYYAALNWLGQG